MGARREWMLRQPGGQELLLQLEPGESVTLGRDLACELAIIDAGISRHHAVFTLEGEELWLEDLHSQNGTFVNTERVVKTRIQSGDIVTLGRVSLTVTARSSRADETDPLRRLPQADLARLVRLSRELGPQQGRSHIFQQLLDLSLEALKADRGLVFLWEEEKNVFHPMAASPHELFQTASRTLGGTLGSAVMASRRTRLLTEPLLPGAQTALLSPLFAGQKTVGLLYLDRSQARRAFQPTDADFLTAFAWITSAPLAAFAQLSDTRDWNERLESLVNERTREIARLRLTTSPGRATPSPTSEWLAEIEQAVAQTVVSLEHMNVEDPGSHWRSATRSLHLTRLVIEATRRLGEWHPERLEAVEVRRLANEISGLDRNRRKYELLEGGELAVFCDPEDVLLALRLLAEAGFGCSCPALQILGKGGEKPGDWIQLRLARSHSDPAPQEPTIDSNLVRLAERLAERVVVDRLHGEMQVDPDGSWAELRLPQPATSLGETILLPR